MSLARRLMNLGAFGTFLGFAISRFDDPNTFVWTLVYGYAAMLSLMAALGVRVVLAAFAGALGYAVTAYTRESGGLMLCSAWAFVVAIQGLIGDLPDRSAQAAAAASERDSAHFRATM